MKLEKEWYISENDYVCPYCQKHFPKKGICTHIQRVHLGIKFGSGYNGHYNEKNFKEKISESGKKYYVEKFGKIKEFKVVCFKCQKTFIVNEREFRFPEKKKYFCSRQCANSREKNEETKRKISEGVIKSLTLQGKQRIKNTEYFCSVCGCKLDTKRKYCKNCYRRKRREHLTKFKEYQRECQFDFKLSDYPDKFDFSLIKEYGWYKAKNHGNNLDGISRDHMVSITHGFKNNIDPQIIKHQANCQLLRHNDNSSKHIRCSISIENLLQKIKEWDQNE